VSEQTNLKVVIDTNIFISGLISTTGRLFLKNTYLKMQSEDKVLVFKTNTEFLDFVFRPVPLYS